MSKLQNEYNKLVKLYNEKLVELDNIVNMIAEKSLEMQLSAVEAQNIYQWN